MSARTKSTRARITGAHLHPLSRFAPDQIIESLPKDKKIVIHCKAGGRSAQACQILSAHAPDLEYYNLKAAFWTDRNRTPCQIRQRLPVWYPPITRGIAWKRPPEYHLKASPQSQATPYSAGRYVPQQGERSHHHLSVPVCPAAPHQSDHTPDRRYRSLHMFGQPLIIEKFNGLLCLLPENIDTFAGYSLSRSSARGV